MSFDDQEKSTLLQRLEQQAGIKLQLKINDNRSTMLSVKWGEPDCTKVSLHRMFLQAPQNIMQELACYLKGEHKTIGPSIKAFIEKRLPDFDYSHQLDFSKLQTKGRVHDLQQIYHTLNRQYFDSSLNLHITWFGTGKRQVCNRVTFGLFHDALKLIKVNRLIDNEHFPEFFVSYVIYHEMLHSVCPVQVDEKGYKHIHSKAFKVRERLYKDYQLAQKWIRDNHDYLFDASY